MPAKTRPINSEPGASWQLGALPGKQYLLCIFFLVLHKNARLPFHEAASLSATCPANSAPQLVALSQSTYVVEARGPGEQRRREDEG